MSTKDLLTAELKRYQGSWVSGESLSTGLSVSRSAIWKHVSKLRNQGYVIDSSPNKGYRLEKAPDMLLPEEIQEGLKTRVLGQKDFHHFQETASTNTTAKELAAGGAPEGTLVVAEGQSHGKGRLGREWFSPLGEGVYLSLILRPKLSPADAPKITLLTAVAAAEALRSFTGLPIQIKWPNDILLRDKKLAGILTEISTEMDAIDYVIIGLGLNVNVAAFPADLRDTATSLLIETGRVHPRVGLTRAFLEGFESWYGMLQDTGFEPVLERWRQFSAVTGRRIVVETMGDRIEGTALDINRDGLLIVEDDEGHLHRIYSGDVTLKRGPS